MLPQLSRHEISLASVIHLLQCGLALRNSIYLNRVQLYSLSNLLSGVHAVQ